MTHDEQRQRREEDEDLLPIEEVEEDEGVDYEPDIWTPPEDIDGLILDSTEVLRLPKSYNEAIA